VGEDMPEKIRKINGKEYRLQFSEPVVEREAKEFANSWADLMRVRMIKSDFKNKIYPKTKYYYIYARARTRDMLKLP
jgi:hypothetical protein